MNTRLAPLALLVLLASLASAQTPQPDVIVSASATPATVVETQRVTISATVTNRAAVAIRDVSVSIGFTRSLMFLDVTGPSGWTCTASFSVTCTTPSLAAGESAQFVTTGFAPLLFPNEPPSSASVVVRWIAADGRLSSGGVRVPLTIQTAPVTTDLVVTPPASSTAIRLNETVTHRFDVRNAGPSAATRLWLMLAIYAGRSELQVRSASGAGWSCTPSGRRVVCRRDSLAAGESAPIDVEFVAPSAPGHASVTALVFAEETHDSTPHNNMGSEFVSFGNAEDYERLLIPVFISGEHLVPRAGARWDVDATAFIDSNAPIDLFRDCPGGIICIVPEIPLRRPFDAEEALLVYDAPQGMFVGVRRSHAHRLRLNLRVRDLNRTAETWGTEIPVIRENEFRNERIVLMPLPVDAAFRHTLRVYGDGNIANPRVAIRVYGAGDTEPRMTIERTLEQPPGQITPALLPRFPTFTQLDPIATAGLTLEGTAWIEIEPLTPGMRFWAFATVTNNATSHVTTITPQ